MADERSVHDLAADIGGKIDILVNTSEHIRPGGLLGRRGVGPVKDEIEQIYLGFVHLAKGSVLRCAAAVPTALTVPPPG